MTDIVLGGSQGCNGINPFSNQPIPAVLDPRKIPNAGWNATVGWDPVCQFCINTRILLNLTIGHWSWNAKYWKVDGVGHGWQWYETSMTV